MVNKQAIEYAPTIPFPEGFALVSNRMGKGVQAGAELQFARETLALKIFDPSSFSGVHYYDNQGTILQNAIRDADPAAVPPLLNSIRPMLLEGNANTTRPDNIFFMSVDCTISEDTERFCFSQLFKCSLKVKLKSPC